MLEILALAAVAAAGVLFLVFKLGRIRRILAFGVPIDIAATIGLVVTMAGSFMGVMIALTAGTMISVILWGMKKCIGADTLTPRGWEKTPRQKISLRLKRATA